jgi:predicted enzyme related to lactoylglutathione lyase
MSTSKGHFVWCELGTTDTAAATAFYSRVIGWQATDAGMPDFQYMIMNADAVPVGGIMTLPPPVLDAGARPAWIGYIGVDDVDGFAARVAAAGGTIHRPADDIPGVGRFAVVADPQGAVFCLFKPQGEGVPPAGVTGPGRIGWHELHAADRESAFAFYADLFGWTKTEAIDMGPMGVYQTFATGGPSGDTMVGGMMTKTDAMPRPVWLYYFNVVDTPATIARVRDAGGQVLMGPQEVPGGMWIAQCLDPQGVMFAVVGANPAG